MITNPLRVSAAPRSGGHGLIGMQERVTLLGGSMDTEKASTGRQAVARNRELAPDVVLMDVRMPDLDGIGATRELSQTTPRTRILILTTFEGDDYIFDGLRAGASGFLLKRTRPEELIAAVHTIAAGTRCSPHRSLGV